MKYIIEINEDNGNSFYSEESAVDKAIATFWADTLAYVNIDPAEVEVDEVRGYPSEEEA